MADTVLRVEGIVRRYGATVALDGVGLDVCAGEVHAVIGENGAGKSTLMGVLAGALRPDGGRMTLNGEPFAPSSPLAARQRGIVLIHQELSLCPHLTVAENVMLGAESSRAGWVDRAETQRRALALLGEMPHPEIRPDRVLSSLSLPARQVVEICRALAADARVVLMDEPTSSLQGDDVTRLFALIRRLTARGIAVIYISHFLEEVRQVADRFTVLRDGRRVASGMMSDVTTDALITHMVGRTTSDLFPQRRRGPRSETALVVRELSAPPVVSATFEVHKGEVFGIAGLIGSGRTELVRALFALEMPTSGTIEVPGEGKQVTVARTVDRVREGFGYLSEDRKEEGLALPLSISDNICATRPSYIARRAGLLDLRDQRARARRWMEELRVRARSPRQAVRSLSGGNQQKVAIARLLNQEADILLLDEPTRGIDIGSKAELYEIIARRADAGCAVIVVSSYLPELFGLCDRIAVMRRGRLSGARPVTEWSPESLMAVAVGS